MISIPSVFLTAAAPTAATEPALDIESIKQIMDGFDPAALLPELDALFETVYAICRVAVLAGPVILLVLGLAYLLLSPREANYYFGYRCYYGMGSVEAWRYIQRLAGIVLGGLGLVLTGIMLVISGGFASMDTMDMVWKTVGCLAWEAVLALAANVFIWVSAMLRFDRKGEYRGK